MRVKDIKEKIDSEIEEEMHAKAAKLLKEKKKEIIATERVLTKLKKEYNEILETEIEEFIFP